MTNRQFMTLPDAIKKAIKEELSLKLGPYVFEIRDNVLYDDHNREVHLTLEEIVSEKWEVTKIGTIALMI